MATTPATVTKPMRPDQMLMTDQFKAQIAAALPKHLNPDRMMRIFLTELRKNPNLARVAEQNSASFYAAIIQAAQLGLEPGSGLGQAFLIPYGNEVQLQIGWQGMVDIAMRSGKVAYIMSDVVYHDDHFIHKVTQDGIIFEHERDYNNDDLSEKNIKLVYAMAKLTGGGTVIEVMTKEQVDKDEQKMRKGKKSTPWTDHWDQMARKTVVRRLYKSLPKSPEMAEVVQVDHDNDNVEERVAALVKDQMGRLGASSGNELQDIIDDDDTIQMSVEGREQQPPVA